MLFNSVPFLFFLPAVVLLYFNIPTAYRLPFLVAASCFFYMWARPLYILIFFYIVTVDYFAAIQIEKSAGKARKGWLLVSLAANLGLLFFFKGFGGFSALVRFFNWDGNRPIFFSPLFLPIGLSFHTFQAMSYTLEVYYGRQKAEKNFMAYALYVMFFPQLVAGPIERPQHLLPQIHENHSFRYANAVNGLRLMLWGFFKKVVVADPLSLGVDQVFNHVRSYSGFVLGFAAFLFAFQILCDFSGYSDIAVGAARILGFNLVRNFNNPYASASCSEFWHRWHISLSSWFRDYVYIPLGGNRVPPARLYLNLMATFLLSGLWHGFNDTFLAWGALNGFYVAFGHWTRDLRTQWAARIGLDRFPRLHRLMKIGTVFCLTCFAWIFFRANSLGDALYVVTHLGGRAMRWEGPVPAPFSLDQLGGSPHFWFFCLLAILVVQVLQNLDEKGAMEEVLGRWTLLPRWAFYYFMVLAVAGVWFILIPAPKPFLYFQF